MSERIEEDYKILYERLREACIKEDSEICQLLGEALQFPMYKDDQKTFPGATESSGYNTFDHVPVTLAMMVVSWMKEYRDIIRALLEKIHELEKEKESQCKES